MSFYSDEITKRVGNPVKSGRAHEANAIGTNASFVCGSALRISLRIEKQKIVEAKFQSNGCGYLIAAADLAAEIIANKELSELHGLKDLTPQIQTLLGDFPKDREHCIALVIETLQAAFNDYRAAKLVEFVGETALICTCFGISEETIEKVIATNGCETVDEVSQICNAGGGCGSCQPLIQEIIDTHLFMI